MNVATPVVTFPYLTRILGAPGVGAVNFVGSFLQNFVIVSALGLGVYGVREVSRFKDDPVARVSLFFELCVLQGVMSLLLAAAYFLCVWRLDAFAGMRWVSAIYGITLVLAPLSFEWFFIGMKDFSYVSIRNIIFRLASIPLVFIFVKDAGDSSSYLLIMFLISTGSAILNLIHFRRHYFVRFSFAKLQYAGHFRPLVILGVYNVLTNVYLSLPLTFLGFLSGHMEVGYYYAANRIVQVAITVMAGMNLVLVPSANLAHSEGDLTSLGKIGRASCRERV